MSFCYSRKSDSANYDNTSYKGPVTLMCILHVIPDELRIDIFLYAKYATYMHLNRFLQVLSMLATWYMQSEA